MTSKLYSAELLWIEIKVTKQDLKEYQKIVFWNAKINSNTLLMSHSLTDLCYLLITYFWLVIVPVLRVPLLPHAWLLSGWIHAQVRGRDPYGMRVLVYLAAVCALLDGLHFLALFSLFKFLVGNCAHSVGGFTQNVLGSNGAESNCGTCTQFIY